MSELQYLRRLMAILHGRLQATRHNEGGYSTEAVVITALLVALAVAAVAIISTKVLAKANGIETG